uniref:Uncharacterized protein n=1 Tax=Solibacter usitatus (strain Ellin6076) TaxID=234267 RepID=Q025K1_SOLUE
MTRAEFIQRLVLNTITDDFDNVDQVILSDVAQVGAKYGLAISRSEVVEAMRALVEAGLARPYELYARDPYSVELPDMPPLKVEEVNFKTYFYVTERGMDFHEADGSWWPFDDQGALRPDWNPPEE